jgi:hypothetical protein
MTGRTRAIAGACLLCALLVSAFAAQSASAVTKGTTAFTCKETGTGDFKDAHCKEGVSPGTGSFKHVEVAKDTTTHITVTDEKLTKTQPNLRSRG